MYKVTFLTRGGKKCSQLSDTIGQAVIEAGRYGRTVLEIDTVDENGKVVQAAKQAAQSVDPSAEPAIDITRLDFVVVNTITGNAVASFMLPSDAVNFIVARRAEECVGCAYDVRNLDGGMISLELEMLVEAANAGEPQARARARNLHTESPAY